MRGSCEWDRGSAVWTTLGFSHASLPRSSQASRRPAARRQPLASRRPPAPAHASRPRQGAAPAAPRRPRIGGKVAPRHRPWYDERRTPDRRRWPRPPHPPDACPHASPRNHGACRHDRGPPRPPCEPLPIPRRPPRPRRAPEAGLRSRVARERGDGAIRRSRRGHAAAGNRRRLWRCGSRSGVMASVSSSPSRSLQRAFASSSSRPRCRACAFRSMSPGE
jgi:hypothetical protein